MVPRLTPEQKGEIRAWLVSLIDDAMDYDFEANHELGYDEIEPTPTNWKQYRMNGQHTLTIKWRTNV